MTQQKTIPVRFVYRSESMIPLLSVMEGADIWKTHGLDVRDHRFTSDPLDAEEQLLDGGIDFIFGNHVTPYMRLAHGDPMVCLAQTENWLHQWVATAPAIGELRMLRGKRVVGKPLFIEGKFCGHSDGNRILLLELEGVDTRTVEFLLPEKMGNAVEAVRDGRADACFISPGRADRAAQAGLRIHKLPPMPMVHSITFTTTRPRLAEQEDEDFGGRILKVLVDATHFFKTRREESLEMLKNPISPLREGELERIAENYEEHAAEYETKPFPRAEAIVNVHKLACMVYPESKTVNPMELWDTSLLRGIHDNGYVDQLYGGRAATTAHVQRELERAFCDNC